MDSQLGEATETRGGKRKKFYELTILRMTALLQAKSMHDQLWDRIPSLSEIKYEH